jgi:SAM-dependent methyltransferase
MDSRLDRERGYFDESYLNTDLGEPLPEHPLPQEERGLWQLHVGDVTGKTVLDCGAGDGKLSVWLAQHGAQVISVELSPVGCKKIMQRARLHDVDSRVIVICEDLCNLESVSPNSIDLALGFAVLHHVPAEAFGKSLVRVLKPGASALFFENSSRNPLYRLGRSIRNSESPEGSPLTPEKVDLFLKSVGTGERIYPRFGLFAHAAKYVFTKSRIFRGLVQGIDKAIDRIPGARPWSSHLWVHATKGN